MSTPNDKLPGSAMAELLLAIDETRQAAAEPEREFKVIRDEEGLVHYSVTSDRGADVTYVAAMCEVFDEIDKAFEAENPQSFGMPKRRWPADQETEGMVTCLRCIGI